MAHRQEDKERRKQERIERERAAAAAAKRTRLLQILGGVVVAAAIVVGIVLAVSKGGGGGGDRATDAELKAIASTSGCVYRSLPDEGETHLASDTANFDGYKSNPPTSGNHRPTPGQDGIYAPGNEPDPETWVHTLEHGRIILMYKPGASKATVDALRTLFNEPVLDSDPAYHMVLLQNNSKMPFEVAAVSWRHYMACEKYAPKAIDAMRAFRDARVDKAPEFFP